MWETVNIGICLEGAGVGKYQKAGVVCYKFICRDVVTDSSVFFYPVLFALITSYDHLSV